MKEERFDIALIIGLMAVLLLILLGIYEIMNGGLAPDGVNKEQQVSVSEPDTLNDWQMLQMAIIMTESKFDPAAHGSHNDAGLYQMIPIYVAEVNRLTGADYSHEDAYDMDKAMEMFDIYQSFKNPDHDIDLAIYHHNKATWYKRKVLENYEFVQRYETVRERITER